MPIINTSRKCNNFKLKIKAAREKMGSAEPHEPTFLHGV